ncbi:MAG: hypothetical protein KJ072_03285 [Verrucomicrobia bacterium]|nr:hypothetical protein [Verrucomicrobiota bacterium]
MKAGHRLLRGVSLLALALWLVALLAVGTTILLFFAGLIIPKVTVRTILEGWSTTALVLAIAVVGGCAVRRGIGRLFDRFAVGGYVWATLFAVSLIVLFYVVERWRGHRAWERLEAEAGGQPVVLRGMEPFGVAEAENFAELPLISEWWEESSSGSSQAALQRLVKPVPNPGGGNWETQRPVDLGVCLEYFLPSAGTARDSGSLSAEQFLEAWEVFAAELEQLSAAAERPYARFELPYDRGLFDQTLPRKLDLFRAMATAFRLRAVAAVADGASGRGLADIERLGRIADLVGQEPLLERQRLTLLLATIQPIWEGINRQRWSEAQLAALQAQLSRPDLLREHRQAVRMELLLLIDLSEKLFPVRSRVPPVDLTEEWPSRMLIAGARFIYPSGWLLQNQVGLYRLSREIAEYAVAADQRRAFVEVTRQIERDWVYRPPSLDPFFATFLMPRGGATAEEVTRRYAYAQSALDLAATACAIERYRLARRQMPESLEQLVPDWIARVPVDLIDGRPLRYRRQDGNRYVLYSVGWNQIDEGGTVVERPTDSRPVDGYSQGMEKGDWVWTVTPVN